MKISFFKIPHWLSTSGCRGTFGQVFCELQSGCRQNRFWCGPTGHQRWASCQTGTVLTPFAQPLFPLQTGIQICAVARQFNNLLEKSQDILAWIQNSFVFDYLSLKIKKPISTSFWFHPQKLVKLCLPQSNSNFAKVCLLLFLKKWWVKPITKYFMETNYNPKDYLGNWCFIIENQMIPHQF